jgi:N-acetylmuramoyl-L-alanine amidase
MVAIGYQPPQKIENVASATTDTQQAVPTVGAPSVDQLVATNIAAGIAVRADLPIAANVANLSLSLSAESELAQGSNNTISKPQIVQPTADGRDVRQYIAKAGDTAQSVAAQFNISVETLKWANNLSADAIEVNKQLTVPPVNGVVYTVKAGDSVESLAGKYQADKARIVSFNDLELGGLTPGRSIIIPGGILPDTERPGYVAPRRGVSQGAYNGGFSTVNAQIARATGGNKYAFGYCTWYAYERRVQLGRAVGGSWGNASSWAQYARVAGFVVNNAPAPGAIMQNGGGAGHVAIVEAVNGDGSLTLTEMNYAGNWNRVTSRTVDAATAARFTYIH